ncbi:helix-turn-helix transcriptional regulator [Paenarthrobacter sp. GOM3]|uniref:helix-turn-helix domain-containing protein n=1 Tax=Paenarthrobacter sp. GOM3 TaxID=2782567 RepID=UPI001BA92C56|nr:helix-turn-helix transcriptional regulator [Paenarthrobacter sp. GOM3]WOH18282.1 helix-turn-helix transcriptional regulator [Paenarthrobacter sp. GOM3]
MQRKAVRPAEIAGEGVDWLTADLSGNVSAEYARLFASALVAAIDKQKLGVREVGRLAGVSHTTVLSIIEGRTVPDLGTIALLEKALGRELLPTPRLV